MGLSRVKCARDRCKCVRTELACWAYDIPIPADSSIAQEMIITMPCETTVPRTNAAYMYVWNDGTNKNGRKKWMLCGNRTYGDDNRLQHATQHTIELPRNVYKTAHNLHFIAFAWNSPSCVRQSGRSRQHCVQSNQSVDSRRPNGRKIEMEHKNVRRSMRRTMKMCCAVVPWNRLWIWKSII